MTFDIPGQGPLTIKTIILDLNGTLSVGGVVPNICDALDLFIDAPRLAATLRQ